MFVFSYFVVCVRCRRKKFTFAISSSDEFLFQHGVCMLHRCTYGECARKENLNTVVLKNYHSHDHCLLSKWKRRTCAHATHLCNMTKAV